MNVSQAEYQNMKEEIVKDMIARLMEERGLTMQAAFDAVYTSRLFEKLSDPKTGLYFQSSGYGTLYIGVSLHDIFKSITISLSGVVIDFFRIYIFSPLPFSANCPEMDT